jgi:pilus assembly protein CpaC
MRKGFLFGAQLFTALPFMAVPAAAATTPAASDEASARVIEVTTKAGAPTHQSITLGVGKSAVVELDSETHDVLVSSPDIVDAVVRSPKRVFLLGQKTGQTNAFFFDTAGRQILSLDIRVEKDVTDLAALMKANLPNSAIKVAAMNDNVILSGSVSSAQEAGRAADLAAGFTGDPKKVVNMLGVVGGEQVMLKVRIAEMDRTIAKQLGVNLATAQFTGGVVGGNAPLVLSTANPYGLVGRALSDLSGVQYGQVCSNGSTTVNPLSALTGGGTCSPLNTNAQATLNALEQVGLAHLLAEPNLTAVNGETARFLAGGEFPIPVSRDRDGNITVDYKQFGVGLSFTPVVLSSGRISLQISTEVSELTSTGSYQVGFGTNVLTIPALAVRRAQTTVELPSGGSFAIAGLMQHNNKQTLDSLPGVKDLPVLGALFRSRDFQNDETELVVMVSAYLVNPVAEASLASPTDGFVTPTDPETLLLGRLNAVYKKNDQPLKPQAAAPVGFVVR